MTPEQTQEWFAALFDDRAMAALAPMLTLAVGLILALLAGALALPTAARRAVVAATLLVAATFQTLLLADQQPPGLVLDATLISNHTTALWGLIFLAATGLAWLFSLGYYREDAPFEGEHDALVLATPIGMMLMAGAQDLIVFFVGLELLSIPLYALAAFRRSRTRSVEAGLKYFLLGAFSAAIFLYGAALLYTATGTVSLPDLQAQGIHSPLAAAGVALLAASVFFKVSVFPFHLWVPDVYEGSPTPIAGLMATGTKAAAFAFLLNATFLLPLSAVTTISAIALITMALGNLGALVQTDLKRLLAYSSIAHAGTLLIAVAAALAGDPYPNGVLQAALFYLAAYAFTTGGAFGLLAYLERTTDRPPTLDSLRGLSRTHPYLAAALTLFMLSLGGIPATGGFLGKYLVFYAAIRAELYALAIVGILLSVIAVAYYLRVVVAMYMQLAPEWLSAAVPIPARSAVSATIAASICAILVLGMGLLPRTFLDLMR